MNTQLRRTFYFFVAGFAALIVMLAYWQVYAQESIANAPENSLQAQRANESPRGLILARDGETELARSEPREVEDGTAYDRVYPGGAPFANVVGYTSTRFGQSGLEARLNSELTGEGDPQTLDELINRSTGGPQPGSNVELTLDPELQETAYEALSETNTGRGAAVAVEPDTGELLALVTHPSYDPNDLDDDDRFAELQEDPDLPLIDRATQSLYPPGSTFKVITAAAGLEAGIEPSDDFFDSGEYETPGYTVVNYQNRDYGEVTFSQALVFSINAVFAEIAVEVVGAEELAAMAQAFGFGDEYEDFIMPVAESRLGLPPSEWAPGNTAPISFGQDQVVSNAFEMALVSATIANGGERMAPRLLREVRSPEGVLLERTGPEAREEALSEEAAGELNEMMQQVVTEGGLTQAEVPGVEVAGKTGTAEVGDGDPHSWWISFAPADDPQIAVAVMVENGGELDVAGGADTPAIPVATSITEAYLDNEDES
ncbi:MAG: penicillin-binding protein 2 [Rubrobacter sp.]|nr:penicillin-binding protein 2 [Rubrobacter sp.]